MTNPQARLAPPLDADYSTLLTWLKAEHTSRLVPAETILDVTIALFEKLDNERIVPIVFSDDQLVVVRETIDGLERKLGVYKQATDCLRAYVRNRHVTDWDNMINALNEVDHLEAEYTASLMERG